MEFMIISEDEAVFARRLILHLQQKSNQTVRDLSALHPVRQNQDAHLLAGRVQAYHDQIVSLLTALVEYDTAVKK